MKQIKYIKVNNLATSKSVTSIIFEM